MAFETFDLGRVIQTAEAIKGMRAQSTTDRLREQFLGEQIETMRTGRERQQRMDEITLGKEKATQVHASMQHVLQAPNPKNFIEQNFPELVTNLQKNGVPWENLDDNAVKQMAQGISAKAAVEAGIAAPAPVSSEGKLIADQRAGFLTPDQVAAANAPKNGTDYDNFLKAQKDPAFAQFLRDKRGKGFSMTLPDGTVVEMGGSGGGVSAAELSGPTKNKLQESIVQATDELDRLNSIGQGFDPQFLQIPGRLKGGALKVKDLAGGMLGDLTPEEQNYLTKFSTFKADATKNLSMILNRLSGAAISPAEGERLKKGIPNDEDSPTQFTAKYQAAVKDSSRAIMRANWALKNGIGVQSVEQLSRAMPLSGIDEVYSQRANEIWQEMGGTPETKQQAIQQANQEFGLAR